MKYIRIYYYNSYFSSTDIIKGNYYIFKGVKLKINSKLKTSLYKSLYFSIIITVCEIICPGTKLSVFVFLWRVDMTTVMTCCRYDNVEYGIKNYYDI